MEMKKNLQYKKSHKVTLQKIGKSKAKHLQVMRTNEIAIQTILGVMQMSVIKVTPNPKFEIGGINRNCTEPKFKGIVFGQIDSHGDVVLDGSFSKSIQPIKMGWIPDNDTVLSHSIQIDTENICFHDWDFDPKYTGFCPQPKFCIKCGKYDNNGFNGTRY